MASSLIRSLFVMASSQNSPRCLPDCFDLRRDLSELRQQKNAVFHEPLLQIYALKARLFWRPRFKDSLRTFASRKGFRFEETGKPTAAAAAALPRNKRNLPIIINTETHSRTKGSMAWIFLCVLSCLAESTCIFST